MRRCKSTRAASRGARVSLYRRASDVAAARPMASHVPTSQAPALVCVRVTPATCAMCGRGCACRRRPRAVTTLFHWDIGTVGRKGVTR